MANTPWQLPWNLHNAPHGILDILRGCNVRCKACYNNTAKVHFRTMEEVREDYRRLMDFRPATSIGLIGGEPLMHPQLMEIIRFLKKQGHAVEIFTNGLLLTEEFCTRLAEAGANLIFLHIGLGQQRSDLPDNQSPEAVYQLRENKAKMVCDAGMEAAFSVTLQRSTLSFFPDMVRHFLDSKYLSYCLTTLYRDTARLGLLDGDLGTGITGQHLPYDAPEEPTMKEAQAILEGMGIHPYSYVLTSEEKDVPGWMNFMTAVAFHDEENHYLHCQPSSFEPKYCQNYYKRHGKYPFYTPGKPFLTRMQLLMNGLAGNRQNLKFLAQNFTRKIMLKRLIVQSIANVSSNGRLNFCRNCPDVTVKNGKIVPICMCDNMRTPEVF